MYMNIYVEIRYQMHAIRSFFFHHVYFPIFVKLIECTLTRFCNLNKVAI